MNSQVLTREQVTITVIETGVPALTELAETRHELLLTLGRLNDPTRALSELSRFKSDVANLGVEATVEKWGEFLEHKGPVKVERRPGIGTIR
ncbi:MAG: hypothetical protein HY665_04065 [Chloroflexi bacterium]|nr:hypothetical protein [Chloroflexota bacterium]